MEVFKVDTIHRKKSNDIPTRDNHKREPNSNLQNQQHNTLSCAPHSNSSLSERPQLSTHDFKAGDPE